MVGKRKNNVAKPVSILCEQITIAYLLAIMVSVTLYFDIRIFSVFDLSKITAFYVLISGLAIVYCVRRIGGGGGFVYNPLTIPIVVFIIIACISTKMAIDPVTALLGAYKRYNGLLSLLAFVFMFFTITSYGRISIVEFYINSIIIIAALMCIYGLMQYYEIDCFQNRWSTNFSGRIFGTIGHPAFFSAYLIMVVPLTYYNIIRGKWVLVSIVFLILFLATFYLTKTRATFIGFIVSNIFFFSLLGKELLKKRKYELIIIGFIIIIVSVIYSTRDNSAMDRLKEEVKITGLSGTALTRYNNALIAMAIIKDNPVLGIGLDNLGFVYQDYENKLNIRGAEIQDRIHSDFFDVAVQTGILGLCAYLWCIFAYIKMMVRSCGEHRLSVLVLGTAVFAYFVQNQFSFGHIPILVLFWFILGLSVLTCRSTSI